MEKILSKCKADAERTAAIKHKKNRKRSDSLYLYDNCINNLNIEF